MATQGTNQVIQLEPTVLIPAFEYGPLDYVSSDAVLLTADNLRTIGAAPPRVGGDWYCYLTYALTVAGTNTGQSLTDIAVAATYWDPVSRAVGTPALTVTLDGDQSVNPGRFVLSTVAAGAHTAGMYRFQVIGTDTDIFDMCSGWIEFLPAVPT